MQLTDCYNYIKKIYILYNKCYILQKQARGNVLFHKLVIKNLIINSNILIAPLAGYTDLSTRLIYRKQNDCLAFTEMVSAEGLNYNLNKSAELINSNKADSPLGIQLFGPNADRIEKAFLKIKDQKFDIIDINCGCPIRKILKSNSGAYLLKSPDEINKIIRRLKTHTDKPISIKIRSGWDNSSINYLQVLEAAQEAGADMITLHPRTKSMQFTGKSNWSHIKILKEKSNIPVIGNGDIFSGQDAVRMIKETNCDGIMLARGLIENPFLMEEVVATLQNIEYIPPSFEKRINNLLEHSKLLIEDYGEKRGLINFRKYFRGYLKGYKKVSLLRQKINNIENWAEFENAIMNYYETYSNEVN